MDTMKENVMIKNISTLLCSRYIIVLLDVIKSHTLKNISVKLYSSLSPVFNDCWDNDSSCTSFKNVWTHSQPHVYERGWVYSVRIDMPSMSLQTFTVNIVTPR